MDSTPCARPSPRVEAPRSQPALRSRGLRCPDSRTSAPPLSGSYVVRVETRDLLHALADAADAAGLEVRPLAGATGSRRTSWRRPFAHASLHLERRLDAVVVGDPVGELARAYCFEVEPLARRVAAFADGRSSVQQRGPHLGLRRGAASRKIQPKAWPCYALTPGCRG